MALNRGTSRRDSEELDLRLARRHLIYLLLTLPLVLGLYGFASRQAKPPDWPLALQEAPRRGAIMAADGTIFAEGAVTHRQYPQGTLAAHLIGFSGAIQPDGRYGLEGLELALEERLQRGEDVIITIDPALQAVAQAELKYAAELHEADNGAVVMLEVGTGRILAAASYPEFDPNFQARVRNRADISNRAFLQQIEPGSTLKPLVIAALMEAGKLAPNEIIEAEMAIRVGNNTFRDIAKHDELLTLSEVLRYSSNVAMIKLGQRFTPEELHAWLARFGIGQSVGLRYSYTRPGQLNAWEHWVPQDQASISIGHSVSTTALQLALAYSVFANDGLLIPPRIVEDDAWEAPTRVVSPEVARSVMGMLVYTVENGLRQAKIPGISVAGKTGTADIWDASEGRYIKSGTLGFAGIFPADRPRVVTVVYLQKPNSSSSTLVATPIFRAIGSETVALWGIPPQAGYYAQGQ
jgi:cell division protein FtsI (penicillin-binding protein 3)